MKRFLILAIASVFAVALNASAQDKKETAVGGVWQMQVMSHPVALVLEQEGTKVTGTLTVMGNATDLVGDFVDRTLTLKGVKTEGGGDHQLPADAGPIVGKLLDDGTMEGELSTTQGRVKWTAERLGRK